MRLVVSTLLALLVLTPFAWAQDQADEPSKAARKVLRDYRDDGVVEACDHKRKTLREVLDDLTTDDDLETPDLRPVLEAAIDQHKDGDCKDPEPTPTPVPEATPTPVPTAVPPAATPAPAPTPAPLPDGFGDDGGAGSPPLDDGGAGPPGADDVTPVEPETTVAPAPTPVPPALEPTGPAATPGTAYNNADDGVPLPLVALAALLGLVALLALLYLLAARLGWADARLAAARRAGREAAFRAGGTWGDFTDWIRVGR